MHQKIVSLLMLIDYAALNRFACKDTLVRYLAIKYVVAKRKKQDIALGHKESFSWVTMTEKTILVALLDSYILVGVPDNLIFAVYGGLLVDIVFNSQTLVHRGVSILLMPILMCLYPTGLYNKD